MDEQRYIINDGKFKRLNEKTFDRMYLDCYPMLLSYARCFVTPTDAEEAVQTVMFWLWENRKTLIISSSLQSYLLRAVRNHCLNQIAQGKARQRVSDALAETLQPSYEYVCKYDVELLAKTVNQAIRDLPDTFRQTFVRQRFDGKTYAAIADELGVSVKTVEYRMSQALKILRKALKDFL